MLKRYQSQIITFGRLSDGMAILAAWALAYPLRFYVFSWIPHKGIPSFAEYLKLLLLILVAWPAVLSAMGVYQDGRFLRRTEEIFEVLKAHAVALVVFTSVTFFLSEARLSRGVLIVFGVLGAVFLWTGRAALRWGLYRFFKGRSQKDFLAWYGHSAAIQRIIDWFGRYPEFGLAIRGGFDRNPSELPNWIQQNEIQVLLVRHRPGDETAIHAVQQLMKEQPVQVWVIPDFESYLGLGSQVTQFREVPLIEFNVPNFSPSQMFLKRSFDLVLSLIAILILLPLFVVLALLVKFTSPGPIFYRQERMGLDGKTFGMWKFRSMRVDAESKSGAVWAIQDDQRRTRIGTFLRATSLDELPQLWNVLVGEMSLVGPRPERPVFVSQFKREIPNYMLRHKMKAGITGWAQVNGWRGNTSLERRIECDLYYIRNWSFWLDIKILFLTVLKGFVHPNAY